MARRWELGVPAGSPLIEVDGVRLAVAREGRGPVIVCLHAVGHGGGDFAALTAAMRDRFEVIRLDWPGQGRSQDDLAHPASAARYADLLEGLLQKLGVVRPVIVGNSIGAAAAILYAARRPVRGLVLCDSGGLVAVGATVRRFTRAFGAFFRAGARGAWWYPAAFALYYRMVLPAPAARGQRARVIASSREIAGVLEQAWLSFGREHADIRAVAAGLETPVWFAWARSDRVIPLSLCRPAIEAMRQATVSVFAGGHAPFLEQPAAFLAGFESFLGRLEPAEGSVPAFAG
ncbi:MAG TPA: alpha/beta hydrolase [Phenylobacterium sp.]|jgi:4,5:9,10-diseco-3-hydroxy-5,9,17-trioxoandrosta-1(10),2-diene-4-oate hydrolase